ncbi:MAG: hypothetical protein LBS19_15165 [Clostridiales bacterium]|jgi:hypothetical protein|nr:hypothetical protein [Clostridiales bacterium]
MTVWLAGVICAASFAAGVYLIKSRKQKVLGAVCIAVSVAAGLYIMAAAVLIDGIR